MIRATTSRNAGRRRADGFTLIELAVVVVILGILAAIALPRFAALQRDARIAKVQALWGGVTAASNLARTRGYLSNAAAGASVAMEGANVTMANFYPTANNAGIVTAIQYNAAGAAAANGVNIVIVGTALNFRIVGATTPASCQVSYTGAAAGGLPTITLTTAGC